MRTTKIIHTVSCHTAGEVGDVIVGGVAPPPGRTIQEQALYLAQDQRLRSFMLNEPRGGVFRHVNLLIPPRDASADCGWLIMEPEDTPPMSGSNAIAVATVLLETGILPIAEPETEIVLEAPGGLVKARASCVGGRVETCLVRNVPSFADALDLNIEVKGFGTVAADFAYGGDSFVLVDAHRMGFRLTPDEARDLAEAGIMVTAAANEQHRFDERGRGPLRSVSFCQFTGPIRASIGGLDSTSAVVIRPGKIDRSPCGTGCSARMAVLNSRGLLRRSERFIGRSILGSEFECKIEDEVVLGGQSAIVPSIAGSAWITGTHQHMLDPGDPWPLGYRMADTWPTARSGHGNHSR